MLKIENYLLLEEEKAEESLLTCSKSAFRKTIKEYSCVEISSGEKLTCKTFPVEHFNELFEKAHARTRHLKCLIPVKEILFGEKNVYVFFPCHGKTLLAFVKSYKTQNGEKLPQEKAVKLFFQIVQILKDFEDCDLILNNPSLNKFVFLDDECEKLFWKTSVADAYLLENERGDEWTTFNKNWKVPYIPPEACWKDEDVAESVLRTQRIANSWALGIMLYAMLLSRVPFVRTINGTNTLLLERLRVAEFSLPNVLSMEVTSLIRSLLEVDTSKRFSLKETLNHPLFYLKKIQKREKDDQVVPSV